MTNTNINLKPQIMISYCISATSLIPLPLLPLCPDLRKAGEIALHKQMNQRKRGPMMDVIVSKRKLNRREAKGILKTCPS